MRQPTPLKTFLVVNPQSANGRTGKRFFEIARAVRGGIGELDHAFTTRSGEATLLARDALRRGYTRIVAVGGDGTANEVVNGFFDHGEPVSPDAVFALIPRGTGGDLRKTFGWSNALPEAVQRLKAPRLERIDVGRLTFIDHGGRDAERCFVNVASVGVSGLVDAEVNRSSKALGALSFKIASLKALLKYTDRVVRLRVDDGPLEEVRVTCLAIGNGQFFGGGMWVCPQAKPDDGLFDVTLWSGFGLADFVLRSRAIYDGTHARLPGTRTFRARKLHAECDAEALLDVDGEQPGRLPATFEILPGALWINNG